MARWRRVGGYRLGERSIEARTNATEPGQSEDMRSDTFDCNAPNRDPTSPCCVAASSYLTDIRGRSLFFLCSACGKYLPAQDAAQGNREWNSNCRLG